MLMEQKTWSVHSDMETTEKPVQNHKKKRSQSDKIGRLKYNQQLLKQTLESRRDETYAPHNICRLEGFF